ncbi:deoxyribose-phosphate aldolase [soil metagenome]
MQLARRAIGLIDLTDLADDSSTETVHELCHRAVHHGTAAVCIWPDFVAMASAAVAGSEVAVATVVNFPSGDDRPFAVEVLTERALADGAHEIDVVLPYRHWLSGQAERAADVLERVRERSTDAGALMKVILETGALLGLESIDAAARLAVACGADFIKTSTGKIDVSANLYAVEAMLAVMAAGPAGPEQRPVGIKPSGGIRTYDDAVSYLDVAERVMGHGWATRDTFRFGASGLLDALLAVIDPDLAPSAPNAY